MRRYPTRDGLPVPIEELNLRPSQLDPSDPANYNNHHYAFEKKYYESNCLLLTYRCLEGMQEEMLRDQHNIGKLALHSIYSPPQRPALSVVMARIEQAYYGEEQLKVRVRELGGYALREFTEAEYVALKGHYDASV